MSEGQEINDVHKKLVFSFIRMLQSVKTTSKDNIEGVCHALAHEFDVDAGGVGGVHDSDLDILQVFQQAIEDKQKNLTPEKDEKFAAFVDLLAKKGYFNGAEPGTDDHNTRMAKARDRFNQRNNPYEGLSADQLKTKGNELMGQSKYKEAIAYYTKAIELEPTNHIFFANRAAAHTHIKDYRLAIMDCEKSISINENYSKAFSRLGTALFYDGNYTRAVDAYTKASELEPENESYKADLKQAEEKLKASGQAVPMGGMPNMFGGAGGAGGMPDFSQMSQMMQNPAFMNAATQMMQNPEFSSLVANMAGKFGGGGMANPEELSRFMQGSGARETDEEGNLVTPFGKINKGKLEQLQRDEVERNPKFAGIMEDVRINGFGAFQKYMGDPEVMSLMMKFQGLMGQ
jgi:small glutamine-rich tetratricopeptide repeat-containing protein alpha